MTVLPPLPRILRLRDRGRDVGAMQRALCASKRLPPRATNVFGGATLMDLKAFQRANTPAGRRRVLAPSRTPRSRRPTTRTAARCCSWRVAAPGRQQVAASARRGRRDARPPQPDVDPLLAGPEPPHAAASSERIRPPQFPTFADCSSFATWCYNAAGAPGPERPRVQRQRLHRDALPARRPDRRGRPRRPRVLRREPAPSRPTSRSRSATATSSRTARRSDPCSCRRAIATTRSASAATCRADAVQPAGRRHGPGRWTRKEPTMYTRLVRRLEAGDDRLRRAPGDRRPHPVRPRLHARAVVAVPPPALDRPGAALAAHGRPAARRLLTGGRRRRGLPRRGRKTAAPPRSRRTAAARATSSLRVHVQHRDHLRVDLADQRVDAWRRHRHLHRRRELRRRGIDGPSPAWRRARCRAACSR